MIIALICSSIFSLIATLLAIWSLIQVEAFKRSTHQVTFIDPSKQKFEELTEETRKNLNESFQN